MQRNDSELRICPGQTPYGKSWKLAWKDFRAIAQEEEKYRKKIEDKYLPVDTSLARGIKNMPKNIVERLTFYDDDT